MQISIWRDRDIRMQENRIYERKLAKVREESFSFKRRIICNWKLLKESLTPVEIIDHFISKELVSAELWDYIKNESRRSQMDLILSNVVENIETSDDYDKFETIATTYKIQLKTPRDERFIPEQRRFADIKCFRANRDLIEKELYPKDHIDAFLEWFILLIEEHEALRNKENVRQQMANLFLQNITKPSSIEKGAMECLLESFKKHNNRVLMRLVKLTDAGISYFSDDIELQVLIQKRDDCRNFLMSKWTYLTENFYLHTNLIDELCSCGLVDDDRAESIKEKPRRKQVYSTLRNIVRRIDGYEVFSKFMSILGKESSFIVAQLKAASHKSNRSNFARAKKCVCKNPCKLEDMDFRDKLQQLFYLNKDDIVREMYTTDVDTFMDKLVFDVDDHEIICEAGNDANIKACLYEKIADTKYIQKGSFDCLLFCLKNNEKVKESRQILADMLCSQNKPKQVKNRTAIASRTTDGVLYPENTSKFTEGELKLTVDDMSKDRLEDEIYKVVSSSEYLDKEIGGLKIKVKDTKRSSVIVHVKSNGENVKLIVEKGIVKGDLSSFIRNLLDNENIKMHMIPGHKYKISISLHSKNKQELFSGGHGSHKMRIIKANRELLEEEYDPLPLLKSVFDGNIQKYKSVAYLSHQFVTTVFPHFKEIRKIPERRKRVMQFMDIAEYMIDAETLWGFIEDTANAFSVKKLRDDLHDVNSGQESIKSSVTCSEEGLVFKGSYEVWITEEDVLSPLQSMILETNQKKEEEIKHLEEEEIKQPEEKEKMPNRRNAVGSPSRAMGKKRRTANRTGGQRMQNEEINQKKDGTGRRRIAKRTQGVGHVVAEGPVETTDFSSEEEIKHLEEEEYQPIKDTIIESVHLKERPNKDESFHDHHVVLRKRRSKDMTEDLHNDVLIWIKVRMETLILLGDIRDEIPVATVKTKIAILARHIVFGFAFSVIFALLMADVIGLFGAAAIGFFIGFRTHTNKAYINQDILNKTRTGIIKDKETTSLLIGQVKALKGRIIVPLAESLQRIHLESINDLAKDSLTSSLLKDVDKITKLRPCLEYELKEVERILKQHGL